MRLTIETVDPADEATIEKIVATPLVPGPLPQKGTLVQVNRGPKCLGMIGRVFWYGPSYSGMRVGMVVCVEGTDEPVFLNAWCVDVIRETETA